MIHNIYRTRDTGVLFFPEKKSCFSTIVSELPLSPLSLLSALVEGQKPRAVS
jgi:hypothetical protein